MLAHVILDEEQITKLISEALCLQGIYAKPEEIGLNNDGDKVEIHLWLEIEKAKIMSK